MDGDQISRKSVSEMLKIIGELNLLGLLCTVYDCQDPDGKFGINH